MLERHGVRATISSCAKALRRNPEVTAWLRESGHDLLGHVRQVAEVFDLCRALLEAHPATRLLFTSRERLPEPFGEVFSEIQLGSLDENEAIELASRVLARQRIITAPDDVGDRIETIIELVNAVNRHPRALVLIAPEIARRPARVSNAY